MDAKHRRERFFAYAALIFALSAFIGVWALLMWLIAGGPLFTLAAFSDWRQFFPDLIIGLIGTFIIGLILARIQRSAERRQELAGARFESAAARPRARIIVRNQLFTADVRSLTNLGSLAVDLVRFVEDRPLHRWNFVLHDPEIELLIRSANLVEQTRSLAGSIETGMQHYFQRTLVPVAERDSIAAIARAGLMGFSADEESTQVLADDQSRKALHRDVETMWAYQGFSVTRDLYVSVRSEMLATVIDLKTALEPAASILAPAD